MKEDVGYEEFLAKVYEAETEGNGRKGIKCKGKGHDSQKGS